MAIQLQEFAKQVLFGTTIEEKLSFPREAIIDTQPGSAFTTPRELTRPKHLMLRDDGVSAKHPSQAKLVDERERGKLLHFFGNHELLATELMALAILKFPDAPASFRRGLLETLKDEQIHTRLYMHRMQQCGVEFGELPLSDYFWKSVSSMEDPLDYVTRLSLTFEQANLDYSREYAKVFNTVGDLATAKILDKIYHDEIDHVGFGLKWFRKWKASGKTDWEAYRERLVFPLSPARAKGNDFNSTGRLEAGLDSDFIQDLEIFQQSRGRTPSVHWFNPQAEQTAAANASTHAETPLQSDLAYLPAYLSRQDDLLIMSAQPTPEFLRQIQSYGFHLPEILLTRKNHAPVITRKINDLRPWAWTPDSVAFFQPHLDTVTQPRPADALWNDGIRELFSKSWSANWASKFTDDSPADWLAPCEVYGKPANNLDELLSLRAHYAALGYANIVCKAPFGTAANGIRCLLEGESIGAALDKWLHTIWAEQGSVLIEPWLERVYDFSVQFEQRDAGLKPLAFTRMVNNRRGQFSGIITNGFTKGLAPELTRFLMTRAANGRPRTFEHYESQIAPALAAELSTKQFQGPLGIDAFIYRDAEQQLRLKPVVEINPRTTMGRIAHALEQHNAAGTVGFFQIITRAQLKKSTASNFAEWAKQLTATHPIQLTDEPKPRIRSGSFPLTDPLQAKQFLAVYHVRESVDRLPL
ncbi:MULTISPECIES: DUF455 family protein [unclassified Lentimonas]|uniref:DUF455 family protein n=1 Tax=unclassified Lentimonas TaxID=2630993 RepID=UPI001324FA81|nr:MULTISPECIES: DUF455 family protein [unclassified Lentimonas]CAA6676495.1 Unannotated [Lentimonas sp. CC4]CAA6685335.1 Unannotated [Lentimonas sp. CC6]CAA7074941.1 Unannotated [Lentimonas sp. CC4]CAA7169567.1 Unannotated [Lentimonas sp. CC21]CAA7182672.1 Unannotated [Lentimonas sp. CC8]